MRRPCAFLVALAAAAGLAGAGRAATAYVSDELVLGVYAEQNPQSQRLATLHSGASVETLGSAGDYTQVRLANGTTGWVKTSFLVQKMPAAARVKELEDELSRARATTPALAEAAARSELEQLRRELQDKQAELQAAVTANGAAAASRAAAAAGRPSAFSLPADFAARARPAAIAALVALIIGFTLGYYVLARRVRRKFGGIKVY